MSDKTNVPALRRVHQVVALSLLVASVLFLHLGSAPAPLDENPAFEGQWTLLEEQSMPVGPWDRLSLQMEVNGSQVILKRIWWDLSYEDYETERVDSLALQTGGEVNNIPLELWPDNRHIGAWAVPNATKKVTARWLDDNRTLAVTSRVPLRTSQGTKRIRTYTEYRLSPDGNRLHVLELRSTRPTPIYYTFERADTDAS